MNKYLISLFFLSLSAGSLLSLLSFTAKEAVGIPPSNTTQVAQAIVGTPLAKELQDKPVVVEIFASWCPGCKNIAPTLSKLEQEYKNRVHFVVFDVSDKSAATASEAKANKLGLGSFFNANKSKTATVVIINPKTGQILSQFQNNPTLSDYKAILDPAVAQMMMKK